MPDPKQPLPRPMPKGTSPDYVRIPGQASAIYVPPSESRRATLPAPSTQNRGQSYYAPPGQAAPIYIPPSPSAGKRMAKNTLSDERSKTEIKRLESTNEALTQALSGAYQGGNQPATEYPSLPQNTRVPVGHASFADTPVANTVAAQNVGLQQAGGMAPPPVVPANMQPRPMAAGPRPAVPAMGFQAPDLSALDEAYRNMGRQQGGG